MTRPTTTEEAIAIVLADPARSPLRGGLGLPLAVSIAAIACRVFRSSTEYRALITDQVRLEAQLAQTEAALSTVAAALDQPVLAEEAACPAL